MTETTPTPPAPAQPTPDAAAREPRRAAPPPRSWWPFVLALVLVGLGVLAFDAAFRGGGANPIMFGLFLVLAGFSEGVHAIFDRKWSEFVSEIAAALLFVICGIVIVADPVTGTFVLTLIMSAALVTAAIFRIVNTFRVPPLSGRQTFALSVAVSAAVWFFLLWSWPRSLGWVIGSIAGVALVWTGIAWARRGLQAREADEAI